LSLIAASEEAPERTGLRVVIMAMKERRLIQVIVSNDS
jgi:hypothetical protein